MEVKVETNAINFSKNSITDLVVDAAAAGMAKRGGKVLSKVAVNKGALAKGAKKVIKAAGGKVTREVNEAVKEGAEMVVEGLKGTLESGVKIIINAPKDKFKEKAEKIISHE